jgi:hypothetical protein
MIIFIKYFQHDTSAFFAKAFRQLGLWLLDKAFANARLKSFNDKCGIRATWELKSEPGHAAAGVKVVWLNGTIADIGPQGGGTFALPEEDVFHFLHAQAVPLEAPFFHDLIGSGRQGRLFRLLISRTGKRQAGGSKTLGFVFGKAVPERPWAGF